MQCVILAGGLGTRITSLTANKIPKCLIEINNIPFICYQLHWLSSHGIKDIVLSISHLKEQVQDYVQDGSKWEVSITYVADGRISLGTGGAIRKALDSDKLQKTFMVMYGDSFLPIPFKPICDYFYSQSLPALMTIYKNNSKFDVSNANLNDGLVEYNKYKLDDEYQYIDYGLSILNRDIIEAYIPPNTIYDLSYMFKDLSYNKMLAGYEVYERFYEVGSPAGLKDFKDWVKDENKYINYPR